MVYLKDVPLELVWVVFLLVGGGEGGRRTPTSAYLVAFGVEESKLCKGTLKKKKSCSLTTLHPDSIFTARAKAG